MERIKYNNKLIEVLYDLDCCIVGGGTAGSAAAISALEEGATTVVVEKNTYLGGSQTGALVLPMMTLRVGGYDTFVNKLIQENLVKENIEVDDKKGNNGWFNGEKLKYVLERLILERGGSISYLTEIIDVVKKDEKIEYIVVSTIQGLMAIRAKTFIDTTADATLSRLSGVNVVSGHEKNGENQSMSLRFEMGGIDLKRFISHMKDLKDTFCQLELPFYEAAMVFGHGFVLEDAFKKGLESGELKEEDCKYFQCFAVPGKDGVMSFNCPEIPNSNCSVKAKDISTAILKGREMINRLSNFMVNNIPGFERAYVSQEANMLGIRESSRIVGSYVMNLDDYNKKTKFEDAITKTAYPVDIHGVEDNCEVIGFKKDEYYEIPYRSLITDEIDNLVVAGRCISTSFIIQSSIRVQRTCRATGEAAGIAAALSVKKGMALNRLNGKLVKNIMEDRL